MDNTSEKYSGILCSRNLQPFPFLSVYHDGQILVWDGEGYNSNGGNLATVASITSLVPADLGSQDIHRPFLWMSMRATQMV